MRKAILAPIAIVICLFLHAQDYKADVKAQFIDYTNLLVGKDFAKSIKYVNPGVFKIVSKDQFIQAMDATFNNPDMEIKIEKAEIISMGEKQLISGMHYVKLRYVNSMKMKFKLAEGEDIDTAMAKQGFEEQFGKGNVSYDSKTKYFKIVAQENVVANSADSKNWTFIVVDPRRKALLEKFLPKELL